MATTAKRKQTTTEKGLGWPHRRKRETLLAHHTDGSPCDWDGRPMYKDPEKNWDYNPEIPGSGTLQADHHEMTRAKAMRLGIPIPLPDRLLHGECNRQRGDGSNDHLAWINSGKPPVTSPAPTRDVPNEKLHMPWPWAV